MEYLSSIYLLYSYFRYENILMGEKKDSCFYIGILHFSEGKHSLNT